jgi:hypothetical protein
MTPQNAALLLIDYQPSQLAGVRSMDRARSNSGPWQLRFAASVTEKKAS